MTPLVLVYSLLHSAVPPASTAPGVLHGHLNWRGSPDAYATPQRISDLLNPTPQ